MATGMHMDERSVDCLVLGHHDQDRKVSAKSVTMRAMTLCKNLSGYRELLLSRKGRKKKNTQEVPHGLITIKPFGLYLFFTGTPASSCDKFMW